MFLHASLRGTSLFFVPMKRQNSKTFSILYNWECKKSCESRQTSDAAVSSPYVLNVMVGAYVLVDGHALNQNLGKPAGCRISADYADIFAESVFSYFSQGAAMVDVVFDRYFGAQSIKSQTRVKRGLRARRQSASCE